MPKSSCSDFPQPLKSLKQSSYVDLDYHELLKTCESASVEITEEMAKVVEKATRSQSQSKLWFKYRAGRITASRMKAVCHTDAANPAQSLIKTICYPEAFSFTTKATKQGCKHEKVTQEIYYNINRVKHNNLCLTESGLVISLQWPFVGASPDSVVDCTCCGKGILEINALIAIEKVICKLQLHKIVNFASKSFMESYTWNTVMLTITRSRLKSLYVMLSMQIFVFVHLWQMMTTVKTAMSTLSEYTKTTAFGQNALQKHSTFFKRAYFQKS